ncbi:MAG: CHAT domain-containing protein [Flavobacteriaceae bacterium]|nr:CHAT domain-containing protein [Flavobacteriaceae bacterium]
MKEFENLNSEDTNNLALHYLMQFRNGLESEDYSECEFHIEKAKSFNCDDRNTLFFIDYNYIIWCQISKKGNVFYLLKSLILEYLSNDLNPNWLNLTIHLGLRIAKDSGDYNLIRILIHHWMLVDVYEPVHPEMGEKMSKAAFYFTVLGESNRAVFFSELGQNISKAYNFREYSVSQTIDLGFIYHNVGLYNKAIDTYLDKDLLFNNANNPELIGLSVHSILTLTMLRSDKSDSYIKTISQHYHELNKDERGMFLLSLLLSQNPTILQSFGLALKKKDQKLLPEAFVNLVANLRIDFSVLCEFSDGHGLWVTILYLFSVRPNDLLFWILDTSETFDKSKIHEIIIESTINPSGLRADFNNYKEFQFFNDLNTTLLESLAVKIDYYNLKNSLTEIEEGQLKALFEQVKQLYQEIELINFFPDSTEDQLRRNYQWLCETLELNKKRTKLFLSSIGRSHDLQGDFTSIISLDYLKLKSYQSYKDGKRTVVLRIVQTNTGLHLIKWDLINNQVSRRKLGYTYVDVLEKIETLLFQLSYEQAGLIKNYDLSTFQEILGVISEEVVGYEHLILDLKPPFSAIPLEGIPFTDENESLIDLLMVSRSHQGYFFESFLTNEKRIINDDIFIGGCAKNDVLGTVGSKEVERLERYFNCEAVKGEDFNASNILNSLSQKGLIHLSAHARNLNGGDSELDFGGLNILETENGIVTDLDIKSIDLTNSELVVLASCDSGRGKVLGMESPSTLARSFMQAGSKTVISSLCQVNDEISTELMSDFYKTLKQKECIIEAFQITFGKKGRDKYGLNVLPWVLEGNPNRLSFFK